MKLTKTSTRVAMSLIPMDMVFYKDEANRLYRLFKVPLISDTEEEALIKATCLSKYAPDIIDGEIIEDNPEEVHIQLGRNNSGDALAGVYVLQKNAEDYKFWDITDKISPYLPSKDVTPEEEINDEEREEIHRIREEMESGKKFRLNDMLAESNLDEHKRHIKNLDRILEKLERKHHDENRK